MPAKKEVAVEAPPSAEEKQARQQLAKAESALQEGNLEEATQAVSSACYGLSAKSASGEGTAATGRNRLSFGALRTRLLWCFNK